MKNKFKRIVLFIFAVLFVLTYAEPSIAFAAFGKKDLNDDMAHLIGTDCHNLTSRPPNIDIAQKAISRKVSPDCFAHLNANAAKIFDGKPV